MAPRPLRVALTGGIATGKTNCLNRFAAHGLPVISGDDVARAVVEPGTPGLDAIIARFGKGVRHPDGSLDRGALAKIVFADPSARRDLEAIVHPPVYAAIRDWFNATNELAIADVPLLYETDHAGDFDCVIVVACQPEQQIQRLMARDGLTREDAEQRLSAQLPIEEKVRRADYVIDTSGSYADTDAQVEKLLAELIGRP